MTGLEIINSECILMLIIRKIFNPETFMKTCLYAKNEQVDLVLELDEQGRQIKFAAGSLDFDRFPVDFEVQDDLAGRIFCGRAKREGAWAENEFLRIISHEKRKENDSG